MRTYQWIDHSPWHEYTPGKTTMVLGMRIHQWKQQWSPAWGHTSEDNCGPWHEDTPVKIALVLGMRTHQWRHLWCLAWWHTIEDDHGPQHEDTKAKTTVVLGMRTQPWSPIWEHTIVDNHGPRQENTTVNRTVVLTNKDTQSGGAGAGLERGTLRKPKIKDKEGRKLNGVGPVDNKPSTD